MASIYQDKTSKFFRIIFRFGKPARQFHKSLDTSDPKEAEGLKGRVEDTLRAIPQGWLTLPPHADFWQFVLSGGKLEATPSVQEVLTLAGLFARYEDGMPEGAMEGNSLETYRLHKSHLLRILGGKQPAQALKTTDLQAYANKRSKETYRG